MPGRRHPTALLVFCFLGGALLDFVFNGVFKIIWIVVYGPAYVVAAKLLAYKLGQSRWKEHVKVAVWALLIGAGVGHLIFTGHERGKAYRMDVVSDAPVTLHAPQWSQRLLVSSPKVDKALAALPSRKDVPVTVTFVLNYGCVKHWYVETVAGVDVRGDSDASWTWRTDGRAPADPGLALGPGDEEDRGLPWCKLKFYRGVD